MRPRLTANHASVVRCRVPAPSLGASPPSTESKGKMESRSLSRMGQQGSDGQPGRLVSTETPLALMSLASSFLCKRSPPIWWRGSDCIDSSTDARSKRARRLAPPGSGASGANVPFFGQLFPPDRSRDASLASQLSVFFWAPGRAQRSREEDADGLGVVSTPDERGHYTTLAKVYYVVAPEDRQRRWAPFQCW